MNNLSFDGYLSAENLEELQEKLKKYYGKIIKSACLTETVLSNNKGMRTPSTLILSFEDGSKISIYDDQFVCCEERYISCDNDVTDLNGKKLRHVMPKIGDIVIYEDEHIYNNVHQKMFIEVATDQNFITLVAHTEHNGLHDGFDLMIEEEPSK